MNKRLQLALVMAMTATFGLTACQQNAGEEASAESVDMAPAPPVAEPVSPVKLGSGLDLNGFDTSVRPQDSLFEHVNGKWVAETELPADRARWGTFDVLREKSQEDVRTLVEEVSAASNVEQGSATQKIRDFYNSYMDSEKPNELGVEAIRAELDEIAAVETYDDLIRAFSRLGVYGVNSPIGGGIC